MAKLLQRRKPGYNKDGDKGMVKVIINCKFE